MKNIWTELDSNSGPHASQATALTTRPWLLGQDRSTVRYLVLMKNKLGKSVPAPPPPHRVVLSLKNILNVIKLHKAGNSKFFQNNSRVIKSLEDNFFRLLQDSGKQISDTKHF